MIETLHAMANSEDTTIETFEFKLRANKQFVEASERELDHSRQIYNAALVERVSRYQITGASLGYNEQTRRQCALVKITTTPYYYRLAAPQFSASARDMQMSSHFLSPALFLGALN
jgi:hypothetical protein